MAYIRKRGTSWSYTIDIGSDTVTGKRRQTTKGGFRTKREAELAAAKAESEVSDGTYLKEENVTFRQYTDTWLKYYRAGIISVRPKPGSVRQREYQIKVLHRYFSAVKLGAITRKQYQDALIDMAATISHETRKGVHSTARMIFRRAMQEGAIKVDPTEYAKIPPGEETTEELPKYFEKEQLVTFLQLAQNRGLDNDYAIFLTLAHTGMRIGEACALRWSDVDFENQAITVNGTLHNPADTSWQYEIVSPKTKSSRRTVDVDPILMAELKHLHAKQNEFKMLHRKSYHDGDFVFGRTDNPIGAAKGKVAYGYPPKRRTVERRMERLMKWMDINFVLTPHSLRHTHASLLAEAGVSLEAIQDRLGHKDDTTTRIIYTHVTKTVKRQAADKFAALLADVVK